jgi:hypothetical protein
MYEEKEIISFGFQQEKICFEKVSKAVSSTS